MSENIKTLYQKIKTKRSGDMSAPSINITFADSARSFTTRSKRGVSGIFVLDSKHEGRYEYSSLSKVPTDWDDDNYELLRTAFNFYNVSKVQVFAIKVNKPMPETDLGTVKYIYFTNQALSKIGDYIAMPAEISSSTGCTIGDTIVLNGQSDSKENGLYKIITLGAAYVPAKPKQDAVSASVNIVSSNTGIGTISVKPGNSLADLFGTSDKTVTYTYNASGKWDGSDGVEYEQDSTHFNITGDTSSLSVGDTVTVTYVSAKEESAATSEQPAVKATIQRVNTFNEDTKLNHKIKYVFSYYSGAIENKYQFVPTSDGLVGSTLINFVNYVAAEESGTSHATALENIIPKMRSVDIDFLACAWNIDSVELSIIGQFIEKREKVNKDVIFVTTDSVLKNSPYASTGSKNIINFSTEVIEINGVQVQPWQFAIEIAFILSGIGDGMSATYYPLTRVTYAEEKADEDAETDAGKLFISFDGDKYKLSRAVNSLKSLPDGVGEAMKKIKIVRNSFMLKRDIYKVIRDGYIGKFNNDYTHRLSLITAINQYLNNLAFEGVLNLEYANVAKLDAEAMRAYIESLGIDTTEIDDQEIIKDPNCYCGSKVFIHINVRFIDAIEDVDINIYY